MILRELLNNLQNKIADRRVSQTDLAHVLNMTRANISLRIKNDSEVTVSELRKIEEHFGVSLYDSQQSVILAPKYSLQAQYGLESWGKRLLKLQVAANILDDKVFAKMLNITTDRLDELVRKNKIPTGDEILAIKTNFNDTNIDWLLFGDEN